MYADGSTQHGPIDWDVFQSLWQKREIQGSSLCWFRGQSAWGEIESIDGLVSALGPQHVTSPILPATASTAGPSSDAKLDSPIVPATASTSGPSTDAELDSKMQEHVSVAQEPVATPAGADGMQGGDSVVQVLPEPLGRSDDSEKVQGAGVGSLDSDADREKAEVSTGQPQEETKPKLDDDALMCFLRSLAVDLRHIFIQPHEQPAATAGQITQPQSSSPVAQPPLKPQPNTTEESSKHE